MRYVAPPSFSGLPSPPLSTDGFGQNCAIASNHGIPSPPPSPPLPVARYVPVAPEARLGSCLADSLRLDGILGTGAYGVVYSAVDIYTNIRYAVKTLSKFNADGTPLDERQIAFQTREIKLHWDASHHPSVVSMLKIIDDPDCIYVILEYCPEGDLFYNITERGQYVGKDDLAKRVFLQILDAVEYCHSRRIYHRDLKPENILVKDQGETVKLADFGLAISSDRSEDYGCGSTFYMSPECLDHSSRRPFYFCAPNDVWSLGVILVNLTCGRNPWKQASFEDSTYRAYTRNPGFLKTILPVSDELNDILGMIFTRDPEQRITLPVLKQKIFSCSRFTEPPPPPPPTALLMPLPTPPSSPEPTTPYVQEDDDAVDSIMYEGILSPVSGPSSPASDDSYSDDCFDAPPVSRDMSVDGMTVEDRPDCPAETKVHGQPNVQQASLVSAHSKVMGYGTHFGPYSGVVAESMQPVQHIQPVTPLPPPPGHCGPKFGLFYFLDTFRQYAPPTPLNHPMHFYPQVSFPAPGCF